MMSHIRVKWLPLLCLLIAGLSLQAQAPYRSQPQQQQQQQQHNHAEIDRALLIPAQDAHTLQKKHQAVFVDVRSRFEYNAEHIQNALSFPYKAIAMAGNFPFPKNKSLIMYCGCPHHLSGMSAEILKKKGYTQVKVIDEGYWGWKQMGLPIVQGPPEALKRISQSVEGRLVDARNQPLVGRDILIEHPPTGQLEAARTDGDGRFRMHLHFASVTDHEPLQISLPETPLTRLSLKQMQQPLELRPPSQTAFKR